MDEDEFTTMSSVNSFATPTRIQKPILAPPPPQQPIVTPNASSSSSSSYNIAFYSSIIFLFCILAYGAVSYSRDVQNRQHRSQRHNLGAYNDYAMNLAKKLPNGHAEVSNESTNESTNESSTPPKPKRSKKRLRRSRK